MAAKESIVFLKFDHLKYLLQLNHMREKGSTGIKKEQETRQNSEKSQGDIKCQVCGRLLAPEESNWEGEAGTGMLCLYCKAEEDSCGCSD